MKKTILLTAIIFSSINLFSQGGVNVKYIPIDAVDTIAIGRKVKIDFRSKTVKDFLVQKARIPDTVNFTINAKLIDVMEVKGTGADYWYFDEEYLKSYNYKDGLILRITEIEIQNMQTDSILFRMTLQLLTGMGERLKQVGSETADVWILKEKIEGLLVKK